MKRIIVAVALLLMLAPDAEAGFRKRRAARRSGGCESGDSGGGGQVSASACATCPTGPTQAYPTQTWPTSGVPLSAPLNGNYQLVLPDGRTVPITIREELKKMPPPDALSKPGALPGQPLPAPNQLPPGGGS